MRVMKRNAAQIERAGCRRGRLTKRHAAASLGVVIACLVVVGSASAQAGSLSVGVPTADPTTAAAGQTVTFAAPSSVTLNGAPDTNALTYVWSFEDDGSTQQGTQVEHVFNDLGTWEVTVTVTDSEGNTGSATVSVDVITPPSTSPTQTTPVPVPVPVPKVVSKPKPKPVTTTATPIPVTPAASGHAHHSLFGSGSGRGSGRGGGSGSSGAASLGAHSGEPNTGATTKPHSTTTSTGVVVPSAPSVTTTTVATTPTPTVTQPTTPSRVVTKPRTTHHAKPPARATAPAPLVGFLISPPVTSKPAASAKPSTASAGGGVGGNVGVIGWVLGALLVAGLMVRGGWVAFEPRAHYRRLITR